MRKGKGKQGYSRREFGVLSAAALATPLIGVGSEAANEISTTGQSQRKRASGSESKHGLNIVFIFGDQERFFPKWPKGLSLPGHERLQRTGVTFENHYTSAIICAPRLSLCSSLACKQRTTECSTMRMYRG